VRELPGVGRNLIDHPLCSVVWRSKPGVSVMPDPPVQTMLRYTASGGETNDMQIYMVNHFPGREGNFALLVILQRPKSRGRLHFESADHAAQPRIELNFFSDEDGDDVRRLREGLQLSLRMGEHPAIAQYAEGLQAPSAEVLADDDALDAYVRANGSHNFHPVGTAKMGPASDPGAVVDAQCRVHGVEGLRVVDASVMPEIVRANTNLTCIMIGERVAELIRGERA
ncbi:MAG: choline dehydrogenase, partial [Dehalococcoidia bacterium]|nr:choline dehydrogenase [Dehalococcoidia bacterium]